MTISLEDWQDDPDGKIVKLTGPNSVHTALQAAARDAADTPASGPAAARDGLSAPTVGNHPAARGETVESPPVRHDRRPKVYISGPITSLKEEEWRERFARANAFCVSAGWEVVDPTRLMYCPDEDCGDGTFLADGAYLHHWGCYMRYDLLALLECDAILMLPDWMDSKGAMFELEVAKVCGMPHSHIDSEFRVIGRWRYPS